jgi:hypothetical protein
VENVLGLIGIVAFCVAIVALAAGVTWLVVRLSPDPNKKRAKRAAESAAES